MLVIDLAEGPDRMQYWRGSGNNLPRTLTLARESGDRVVETMPRMHRTAAPVRDTCRRISLLSPECV